MLTTQSSTTMLTKKGTTDIKNSMLEAIGHTPLVRLNRIPFGICACSVLAKIEFFNPGGSIKDRIGLAIIEDAEKRGLLKPGGTIVEATSGNTGAGLAIAAAVKGYHCVFVLPDKMSEEKIKFLRALGARVIITPTSVAPEDPRSYYQVAARIVRETPNSYLANQYHNPANQEAHYQSTGPEIWQQTGGKIDVLVAGMGTGGTISGTARYLKEMNPNLKVVGVDIKGSLLLETFKLGHIPEDPHPKTYKIEGIGEDFLPGNLNLSLVDEVVQVEDGESFLMARRLVHEEGIFAGGSSGSAVAGVLKSEIIRDLQPGQVVVVILPDSGDRYLSKMYDDNWMRENGFLPASRTNDTIQSVLQTRQKISLMTALSTEQMTSVVKKMNAFDISQLPVVDDDSRLIGLVSEGEILDHLLHSDHVHDQDETIAEIINPNVLTTELHSSIESVLPAFERGKVVVVIEDQKPVAMLTKIDLIDFLTSTIG